MPIILVVDDSLSVRKVAERMLREAGLEVALAANGEDAMTWLSGNRPDLVIADVIMPDKSGFEVCAFVRAQASLANTPVLLISGFVDDEVTRQAEACRADGVVKKPFQGTSLRERVVTLLAARKEREALAAAPAIEMPVIAPEPEITLPVAPPAPAATPELVLEMPVIAPEPEVTLPVAPPAPAPVATSVPVAAAAPAAQLEDEVRALLAATQRLDARVTEQEKGRGQLERQLQAFRESTTQAFMEVSVGDQLEVLRKRFAEQESRLAQMEKQSAELRARVAELEPVAASAKQLIQTLAEFARRALKPGEGGER
jgi:CheY-like chemotaxis protein